MPGDNTEILGADKQFYRSNPFWMIFQSFFTEIQSNKKWWDFSQGQGGRDIIQMWPHHPTDGIRPDGELYCYQLFALFKKFKNYLLDKKQWLPDGSLIKLEGTLFIEREISQ